MQQLIGIDFGAKKAGTTVLARLEMAQNGYPEPKISLFQSLKNQDADLFLEKTLSELPKKETLLCIDAPLSLPAYYSGNLAPDATRDYFYRKGDKILGAMSALFLGGLTARAIQFKDWAQEQGCTVIEGYPAALAKELSLSDVSYKKEKDFLKPNLAAIVTAFGFLPPHSPLPKLLEQVENWHQIDALLALLTAFRFAGGKAKAYGDTQEGVIWV
ncbi:DUF429 domain-containing protein [Hugenholtzia roseola]|uniref:DUF429 domain-containing protein n=1 Tax=Hugenholtzia roseola TaxID=1002 RepID=UPI0012B6114E|nr:DUF429 domain-containing protein [Hugenholtzia roseola]